jgi:SET domain-containing protein
VTARRLAVRRSRVHGRGVFALTDFGVDEHVLEYKGEILPWTVAQERYEASDAENGHTFFFDRGDGTVIDGGRGGNASRWINHGCEPNCEAVDDDGRILIQACRPIGVGDELLIDYQLNIDVQRTAELEAEYACGCRAPSCRGTMLATVEHPVLE